MERQQVGATVDRLTHIVGYLVVSLLPGIAQAEEHNHSFELGVGINPSYIVENNHWAGSFHAHGVWFISQGDVGLGVSYEHLIGEHSHNTISLVSQFHAWHGLGFALAPGLTFDNEDINPSFHIEALYEFEVNEYVHIGPMFEVAFDKHSTHVTPGLHTGFLF